MRGETDSNLCRVTCWVLEKISESNLIVKNVIIIKANTNKYRLCRVSVLKRPLTTRIETKCLIFLKRQECYTRNNLMIRIQSDGLEKAMRMERP